jgi:DnaJ-class molecular chaperone
MIDPLVLLDIEPGDTLEIAKKKRNKLFKKFHPDKSKNDKEAYQQVYDAFEILSNNPDLLKPITISENISNSIIVKVEVSLEEVYFKTKKAIRIERVVYCEKCHGMGTLNGISGLCPHCDGKGTINSSILELLGKSSKCPICNGTGVKKENLCDSCKGSKFKRELNDITFTISPIDYTKKFIQIKNCGHQLKNNLYGSVIIQLKTIPSDASLIIEDDYFVAYDKVLPIQKIIGDTKTIKIFGRDVLYKIERNAIDAYTVDNISSNVSQAIRIKFIDVSPILTDETLVLYKKILEIEKYEHSL